MLFAQFYTAISLIGADVGTGEGFFKSYLALPVALFFWACGWLWKHEGRLKISQIDVDSGRREIDWEAHKAVKDETDRCAGVEEGALLHVLQEVRFDIPSSKEVARYWKLEF